jgi:hypothetical protein
MMRPEFVAMLQEALSGIQEIFYNLEVNIVDLSDRVKELEDEKK